MARKKTAPPAAASTKTESQTPAQTPAVARATVLPRAPATTRRADPLALEVEAAMADPKKRLALARKLVAQSGSSDLTPQAKVTLLQKAVRLDPFSAEYRGALARFEREMGAVDEAIIEYRHALEIAPKSATLNVELGETLLAIGKPEEARTCLATVADDDPLAPRAAYGLLECDLRQAQEPGDWQKVLDKLSSLGLMQNGEDSAAVDLFCEKCIKIAVESAEPDIAERVLDVALKIIDPDQRTLPAFRVLERVVRFDAKTANSESRLDPLEGFLTAYLLAVQQPVDGDPDARLDALSQWRSRVEGEGDRWPGLNEAYLLQLDRWASQAYKRKDLAIAAALWTEAERVSPASTGVAHNLALTYTRLGNEANYAWYWDRMTQLWTIHGEMLPEAEAYTLRLIQKHQAFAEGAEKKLSVAQTPEALLGLGSVWMQEAVSLFGLRQLAFRSPYFRCGLMSTDYAGDAEREASLQSTYASAQAWLSLISEWRHLGDRSELTRWRQERLAMAYSLTAEHTSDAFRDYEKELPAFRRHREELTRHYMQLLFNIVMPLAQEIDVDNHAISERYKVVAQGILSFPHRLLQPEVQKQVRGLPPEIDLAALVLQYAVGPWFQKAQQRMGVGDMRGATRLLEEVRSIAPTFALGLFYLAQCYAQLGEVEKATKAARNALAQCEPAEAELQQHIVNFIPAIPQVAVGKELEQGTLFMNAGKWRDALRPLETALASHPNVLVVRFYLTLCYWNLGDLDRAEHMAKDTLAWLDTLPAAQASQTIQSVVSNLRRHSWRAAQLEIERAEKQLLDHQAVLYYKALCHFQLGEWDSARLAANQALAVPPGLDLPIPEHTAVCAHLEDILRELPSERVILPLRAAQKAQAAYQRTTAQTYLLEATRIAPSELMPWYYMARVCFDMDDWAGVEQAAEKALPLCGTYATTRGPLERLIAESSERQAGQATGGRDPLLSAVPLTPVRVPKPWFLDDSDTGYVPPVNRRPAPAKPEPFSAPKPADVEFLDQLSVETPEAQETRYQLALLIWQVPMIRAKPLLDQAVAAMQREAWQSAVGYLDRVLQEVPEQAAAWYYAAICHMRLSEWDSAVKASKTALALCEPTDRELAEQVKKLLAQIPAPLLREPLARMNDGDWAGAARLLDEAIRREPNDGSLYFHRALCKHQDFISFMARRSSAQDSGHVKKGILSGRKNRSPEPVRITPQETRDYIRVYEEEILKDLALAKEYSLSDDQPQLWSLQNAAMSVYLQLSSLRGY